MTFHRLPFIRCTIKDCSGQAVDGHIICKKHLNYEIGVMVICGLIGFASLILFISKFK